MYNIIRSMLLGLLINLSISENPVLISGINNGTEVCMMDH